MKKLLSVFLLLAGLFAASAHAQAVNTRTILIEAPAAGSTVAGWRVYCGPTNDPSTFAAAPVKDVALPALTTGQIPLADTIKFCGAKFYNANGGLESSMSNVVSVTVPGAPVIRITTIDTFAMDTGQQLSHVVTASIDQ